MREEIEDRSLEKTLDFEKIEDELCRCEKSKIKYTRALLLELKEVEACRKLPGDFDVLILRELDGESDSVTEHKTVHVNSYLYSPLPCSRGERWDNHLLTESKKSCWQGDFHSGIIGGVPQRQHLLEESGYGAGILGPKIQKSDIFQLRKSRDPYCPPHKKTPQPSSASSELGKESSGSSSVSATENVLTDSVDSVKGNDNLGNKVDLDDIENSPVGKNEVSCKNNEESGVLTVNKEIQLGTLEDNETTFDDYWDEILDIIHQEQDPKRTPIPFHYDSSDSEAEIRLPDEYSLKTSEKSNLDNSGDSSSSEDKFNLPDEDSLITLDDLIPPHIRYILKCKMESDEVTSHTTVNIRKNLESVVTKEKLLSQLSYTQTSSYRGKENKIVNSNNIHSTPTPNYYTSSYFHHQPFQETTLTEMNPNNSLVKYSVFDQPSISPSQQNRLLIGAKCLDPVQPSQQTICPGFGKSYAAALRPAVKGGFAVPKASGKLYVDAVLRRNPPPGIGKLPGQRSI